MENQTIKTLKELINIPSYVLDDHNEEKLVDYIYNFLSKFTNLTVEKQTVEGKRANILAFTNKSPKIILFGHMDTVRPKIDSHSSFEATEQDNKLFGLGSVDMKSGLAIMLETARKYSKNNDIAYIFTVDEEYDFKGVFRLVKDYQLTTDVILNLEPTSLKILNGCRGVTEFTFEVNGKSCHAGTKHLGVNAIEKAVEIFKILQNELTKHDSERGANSLNLAHLNGGVLRAKDTVGYSGNVVPNYAFCVGEIRLADPSIDENWIEDKIKLISSQVGVSCTNIHFKFLMGSAYTPTDKLKLFEQALKMNGINPEYKDINATGYFEVQKLQETWGTDIIVFGPGPSEMAHQVNEYVDIDSVLITQKILDSYLEILQSH